MEVRMHQGIDVALDVVRSDGFELFRKNFDKNDNSFPYMEKDNVYIGTVSDKGKVIGMIAYAFPDGLEKYRFAKGDDYIGFGHIFDFEVIGKYRGKGIGDMLVNGVIDEFVRDGVAGVTLMAMNRDLANHYSSKYGFVCYDGDTSESPMMYLDLRNDVKNDLAESLLESQNMLLRSLFFVLPNVFYN